MKAKIISMLFLLVILSGCKKESKEPDEPNYTNFKILNVKIIEMPFIDKDATSWDPFDGPDVFFNMEDVNNTVLYNGSSSRVKDIITTDLPLSWDFVNAYQITNLGVTHYVTVYDYDTIDPNDLIGYVGFTMTEHKEGYPKTITKSSGGLKIRITGEWY